MRERVESVARCEDADEERVAELDFAGEAVGEADLEAIRADRLDVHDLGFVHASHSKGAIRVGRSCLRHSSQSARSSSR